MNLPARTSRNLKETGLPWIPYCPDHWSLHRLKYLVDERVEKGYPDEPLLTASQSHGVIPKSDYGSRTVEAQKDLHLLKLVEPGDYVISLRSFQGGIEFAHARGIISPAYTVLKPKPGIRRGYYEHFFKSTDFINSMTLFVTGIREGQNIDYVRLSRAYMPVPPGDEQAAIGRFIRHLDQRVKRLIKAKRQLIELLNEQKQAIIHRAVTRGLNPTVTFKRSGIEWLGEVPSHWNEVKVKWACRTTSGGTPNTSMQELYYGGSTPWIRTTDLTNDIMDSFEIGITDRALQETACKVVPEGTVLVAMYGGAGTIGKNGLLTFAAALNQAVCGVLPSKRFLPEFLFRFMQLQRPFWMVGADGTRKDPNISQGRIRDCLIVEPPLSEQAGIIAWIAQESGEIDKALCLARSEIEFIREYRTRLVADVVTGQLDVRHLDLPEIEESLIDAIDAGEENEAHNYDEEGVEA